MNSDSWCTPRVVVEALRALWPEGIDLDPCSNARSIVGAKTSWTAGSLQRTWFADDRRAVYCNPPYSRLDLWMPAMDKQHSRAPSRHAELAGLVPVATSAAWWQYCLEADALVFTRRLTFIGDKPFPARFDTVVPYFGERVQEFREAFRGLERWFILGADARRSWTGKTLPLPGPRRGAPARRV